MNVSIDQMRELVLRGLAVEKYDEARDLYTFKYHNRVFYENLWNESEALLECRGVVFDSNGAIAQRPFKKVFNLGENGTGLGDDRPDEVLAVKKLNGFCAAASFHKGQLLVSTTGTTTSDFAKLASKKLQENPFLVEMLESQPDFTFIFEICDGSDPHIVEEQDGAYLLGMRHKSTGILMNYNLTQKIGEHFHVPTPYSIQCSMDDLQDYVLPGCKHEGFMIYDPSGTEMLFKTKSPHYLSKKAMMRMGRKMAGVMFEQPEEFRKRLDEEFYDLHDYLLRVSTKDTWLNANEQDRRWYIEDWFERFPNGWKGV